MAEGVNETKEGQVVQHSDRASSPSHSNDQEKAQSKVGGVSGNGIEAEDYVVTLKTWIVVTVLASSYGVSTSCLAYTTSSSSRRTTSSPGEQFPHVHTVYAVD
jgi:hypothetical protein